MRPIQALVRNRNAKNLSYALTKLPSRNGITLVDVGAAGGIEPRAKPIEASIHYVGFEPDERSRSLLLQNEHACLSYEILPFAVSETSGSIGLNLCRQPKVSSAYPPNRAFTDRFPDSRRFDVLDNVRLEYKRLDEMHIATPDFIKLDLQGGELNVLKGSKGHDQTNSWLAD